MERKRSLAGFMAAIGLLVLIFDSKLALKGAGSGIELCIKTVIPSLFPFFVLSMTLTTALGGQVGVPVRKIAQILGIPKSAASILIPSVLGGYPIGAKCVGDLYRNNALDRKEAERLLAFCSNAGPSFLFGMVSCFFPERIMIWKLWLIHLTSAALSAASIPVPQKSMQIQNAASHSEDGSIVLSAAKAMCLVCCWVILFRTMISFLENWFLWFLPDWMRVLVIGILELSNGCCELLTVTDIGLRFRLCSCMLAFGGICVFFQTASVANGLRLSSYVKGKILQTVYSYLLSSAVITGNAVPGLIAFFLPVLVRKAKKDVAITRHFLYNKSRLFPEA